MVDHVHVAEQERVLHRKAHVVDAVLLQVREAPVHFLGSNLVQGRLLNLSHEVLAVLLLGSGDVVEAAGLHVELAAALAHADKHGASGNIHRDADRLAVHLLAVHGEHDGLAVVVLAAHAQHQVGAVVGVLVIRLAGVVKLGLDAHHADGIVKGEDVGLLHYQHLTGGVLGRGQSGFHSGLHGAGAHAVVLHLERVGLLSRGKTADLVDRGSHRANLGDARVDVGLVHVGVTVLAALGLSGDSVRVRVERMRNDGVGIVDGLRSALVRLVAASSLAGVGKTRGGLQNTVAGHARTGVKILQNLHSYNLFLVINFVVLMFDYSDCSDCSDYPGVRLF